MKKGDSAEEPAVEDKRPVQPKKKRRKWPGSVLCFILVSLALPGAVFAGFACLSNPCINGICIDDLNSTYSCYCIDGFTGIQCQTNWDECWSSPCKNGGSCIDGIAEYNCTCPDGYIGDDCEVDYDECDSNPCVNNATCMDGPNGYTCTCLPGYSGVFCEIDIAVCNQTEETRCSNGGKCVEGPGMSFKCTCVSGWEGKLCESQIDECLSSPCENGGLCIDLHADYTCACTFGYTGKNCEAEIELCTNSPCINNALCMLENTIRTCYCVPDYHGEKCQYQYDECLLGPRCMNGGTCIDGVDNFTCSCPPLLTGVLCECLILDNGEYDCDYVSPTPIYEPRIDTTARVTSEYSTSHYEDNATMFSKPITYRTSDYSTVDTSSSYASSESSLQTFVPTITWDQSTSTLFNDNFITIITDVPFTSKQTQSYANTTDEISTMTNIEITTYGERTSSDDDITSVYSTSFKPNNMDTTTIFNDFSMSEKEMTSTEIQSTPEIEITKLITDYKTESNTFKSTDITTDLIYPDITTDHIETSTESEYTHSTIYIAPDLSNTFTTLRSDAGTTNFYVNSTNIETARTTPLTEDFTIVDFISTTQEISNQFTKSYFATTEETLITTNTFDYPVITTESFDCKNIKCQNGGSCIKLAVGPKCVCKFDFDGPLCERSLGVAAAAFSGDSYLTHKLYNASGIRIQLKARTLSTEGMILYSNIGSDTYMCLYISKGHLKFKFSCGYQTMLLSELDIPFNNGFEFRIKAILEFTDNRRHCNASLHINDTLAMSGGQIAAPTKYPLPRDSWLHLGAIPEGYGVTNHSPPDIDAFTGCMMSLQIHDKTLHIFKNASDGFEVKDCTALSCLSNPCLNAGTCSEIGEHSICYCSNGFLGRYCERSVCEINPCQFGGSCVQHPGSGFLCLCPLGKHGLYCEHNLEITQPSFSSMVQGLSSFVVYQFPKNLITQGFELRFTIQPNTMDQISLLAFLGQSGPHDPKSDHLAVTFVKGYLMLTWNLGNGPRRIFTSRPINHRLGRPHTVKVGRMGRAAWLSVDNLQNITGNAPGNQINFNVLPFLYIGGHDSVNFSQLPHDLPLHGGFAGCIWDIWVGNMGAKNGDGGVLRVPIKGRAVGQCSVTQCHPMICHNGGACLHHAATYSCLCPQNWFGPLCTSKGNPCDTFASKCRSGSTCVPTVRGYQCDCPLGYAGKFCDQAIDFSDISLSGVRSYLKLNVKPFGEVHLNMELEVHPMHPKGIIFYAYAQDGCFVSLSLQGGLLEYRWAGYEWGGKSSNTRVIVVVRSGVVLSLGSWHTIRAGRYGRKLYLWVDGTMTTETFNQHQSFTSFNTSIYIGGVHDLSILPMDVMSGHPMSYTGCVRKVVINSQRFPLNKDNIIESRNIDDCDGGVCGGDVCWNGGTCIVIEENGLNMSKCICPQPYAEPHCMEMLPCKPGGCNKGRCINNTCICPSGWRGHTCENQIKMKNPQFGGSSYIMIDDGDIALPSIQNTNSKIQYKRNLDNIYINFTTAQSDGLLLWGEMNSKKYVSLGLEGGFLKISWTLPQTRPIKSNNITKRAFSVTEWPVDPFPQTGTIKLIQSGRLSNGEWHTIQFKFQPGNISVSTDNKTAYEENGLGYNTNNADVIMFIGGLPKNMSLIHHTDGLYSTNFIGCISEVSFGTSKDTITDFSHFESENVEVCQLNF